jgi:hypothetical protein
LKNTRAPVFSSTVREVTTGVREVTTGVRWATPARSWAAASMSAKVGSGMKLC